MGAQTNTLSPNDSGSASDNARDALNPSASGLVANLPSPSANGRHYSHFDRGRHNRPPLGTGRADPYAVGLDRADIGFAGWDLADIDPVGSETPDTGPPDLDIALADWGLAHIGRAGSDTVDIALGDPAPPDIHLAGSAPACTGGAGSDTADIVLAGLDLAGIARAGSGIADIALGDPVPPDIPLAGSVLADFAERRREDIVATRLQGEGKKCKPTAQSQNM